MGPSRGSAVALVALGLAFSTACNKAPAEEALAAAEQTLQSARVDLERFAPDELVALSRTLDEARADLAEGRYTEALRAAQGLPPRIHRAVELSDRKRQAALAADWDDVSRNLPTVLARLRARVASFALTPTMPTGLDDARLDAARTELRSIGDAWDEATAAFEGGDIPRAVIMARDVGTRAEALAGELAPPPTLEAGRQ